MKILPPASKEAQERLCRILTAALPPELRRTHRVVIAKGRFGWYARTARFGRLSAGGLPERRRSRGVSCGRRPPSVNPRLPLAA